MTETVAPKTGFAANEPVVVGGFVAWLFSLLGTFLIGHTHLITSDTWSALSTTLVPVVSAFALAVVAFVVRRYVQPAWKALTKETQKVGISDALLRQLVENGVVRELAALKKQYPQLSQEIDLLVAQKVSGPPKV